LSCPLIIFVAVIILLRFAHVIFIEINVHKIINTFTKIFFVNAINVYHIYGKRNTKVNSAFHSCGVDKSSIGLSGWG